MKRFLLCVSITLSACSAMTTQEFRAQGEKETFVVKANYQNAYRRVSDEMRACLQGATFGSTTIVQSDLYTDLRKGVIVPSLANSFGSFPMGVVDISDIDGATARIDVIIKPGATPFGYRVKRIFVGQSFCGN